MRRVPALLLTLAALCAVVAIVQHVQSRQRRTEFERERLRLLADTQSARAETAETARKMEAERARSAAIAARPKATASAQLPDAPAAAATSSRPPAAPNPELPPLRVQVFVSEQRMQFAALLHRLGFTPAQRQAFDHIQEEFYRAMLDGTLDASGRQQARDARAAALRELFGTNHEAWLEANRQQSARAIVDQIVHQTFPSSGALNAAQADELTRIVAQHRIKGPAAARPDAADYDWERIIGDARTILADRQMEGFIAAVSYRRASDQMSAMAAQAKSGSARRDK